MWRKRNVLTLLVEMKIGAATMENNVEVSQKTKIELLHDPAITLLGIYPDKTIT